MVKNANAGEAGLILGQEDPLEKEMEETYSVFLPAKSLGQSSVWATVHGITRVRLNLATKTVTKL